MKDSRRNIRNAIARAEKRSALARSNISKYATKRGRGVSSLIDAPLTGSDLREAEARLDTYFKGAK